MPPYPYQYPSTKDLRTLYQLERGAPKPRAEMLNENGKSQHQRRTHAACAPRRARAPRVDRRDPFPIVRRTRRGVEMPLRDAPHCVRRGDRERGDRSPRTRRPTADRMNTRTWQRAGIGTLCGRCGATIAKGDPVLRIVMVRGGHTLRFVRCAKCDGPAPPDLPPLVVRSTTIAPSALHRVGTL